MFQRVDDVVVNSEVWYKVVSVWVGWLGSEYIPVMTKLNLCLMGTTDRILDIPVCAEVWNEVVSWWGSWIILGIPNVMKLGLGHSCMLLSINDVRIGSEVWDKVVSICWLLWGILGEDILISNKLLTDNSLSCLDTLVNLQDISISSEMWHKVVLWGTVIGRSWFPGKERFPLNINAADYSEESGHRQ